MRRDDLRKVVIVDTSVRRRKGTTATFANVSDAEALDAIGRDKALKHWFTEPCTNEKCVEGEVHANWRVERCDSCDGRGWVPKAGGYFRLDPTLDERSLTPVVVVPLSMLEGDDQ